MSAAGQNPFADVFAQMPLTFPDREFPTFAVDISTSMIASGGVVKMYFARIDGEIFGRPTPQQHLTPVLQLAMPLNGFVALSLFCRQQLKAMVEGKVFPDALIQELEKTAKQQGMSFP